MKKWGKRRNKQINFKNDFQNEATLVMENKKQTRGKLVTAATIDARVFFFHFFGGKCSNMKNEKKRGKRRTKQILFKNDFQNEATLKMENKKANTWQACYRRRH